MPADTPTLNRAANQIKTVGCARLTREEMWEVVSYFHARPGVGCIADAEVVLKHHTGGLDIRYWGVDANNCFTFREGAPPRMSGRKSAGTTDHGIVEGVPNLGWIGGGKKPDKMPPGWRWHEKRDSGDGAPA